MTKQNSKADKFFHSVQNWLLFFIIFAGSLYLTSVIMSSFFSEVETLTIFSLELKHISIEMFVILRPLIEIVIVLWISNFILHKLGINTTNSLSSIKWTAKNIIILSLLFAFIIASLVLTQAATYLKGVIMVFIGIYLGTNIKAIKSILSMSKLENLSIVKGNDKWYPNKQ